MLEVTVIVGLTMVRRILILISYAASLAVVLVGTVLLVEYGQGYGYDFKSGQFYINGLLSLVSSPASATLFIDGKVTHRLTPYHSTLKTGSFNLELRKDGFRTWSKKIDVLPFQVTSLDTVFLIPNTIPTISLTPNQTAINLVASRDRRHFAFIAGEARSVWVVGAEHDPVTKVYTPAAATADHPAETIVAVSWSADSSHLLVRGDVGGAVVYNLVSAGGGAPTNLSDLYKLDLTGLEFSSYDWRELYWSSAEGLRKLNLADKTVSAVLADKVSGFAFAGDRIVYVHTTPLGKAIWSMDRAGNNQKQLIEALADSASYELVYVNHGVDALAVLPQGSAIATLYLDIYSANPVSKVVSKNAERISFSDNGRFLAFSNIDGFGVYDIEKNTLLKSGKIDHVSCFRWFDSAHAVICRPNEVDIVELDGANLTKVADMIPGSTAYGFGDQRHVYGIGPMQGASSVVFSALVKQ